MKSYMQGLITSAVFIFAFMVLMGSTDRKSEIGKWQMSHTIEGTRMVNTTNGDLYKQTGLGALGKKWKWVAGFCINEHHKAHQQCPSK